MFLLKQFRTLQHLGHFKLWSLNPKQKREIRNHLVSCKMSHITVDTDHKPRPSDNVQALSPNNRQTTDGRSDLAELVMEWVIANSIQQGKVGILLDNYTIIP